MTTSNRPCSVLFVTHGYKPAYRIGGPAISVPKLAEGLVAAGTEVTVLTSNSNLDQKLDVPTDRLVDVNGVKVRYFDVSVADMERRVDGKAPSMGFLFNREIGAYLDSIAPRLDIVHTHIPFVYPTTRAGFFALRRGIPLVYHQRGVLDPARLAYKSLKKRLYIGLCERWLVRGASHLIALTEAEVASYRQFTRSVPCSVVPNGISCELYRTAAPEGFDTANGLPAGGTVFLFLGRLHPTKGTDRLIEAFYEAQRLGLRDAALVFAGPDESGFRAQHEATAANLVRNGNRVVFTGMLEGEQKCDWLARADVFVLPSIAEGLSMAMLEGMASGCALLLSPGCHFPEAESARIGEISDTEPAKLASAMMRFAADRDATRQMGVRARRLAESKYDWKEIVQRTQAIYSEVLVRRKR